MNGKIHDEVLKRKNAITNEKTSPGSFTGTELESWLEKNNKKGGYLWIYDSNVLRHHSQTGPCIWVSV